MTVSEATSRRGINEEIFSMVVHLKALSNS
jgi:hypothetical protein